MALRATEHWKAEPMVTHTDHPVPSVSQAAAEVGAAASEAQRQQLAARDAASAQLQEALDAAQARQAELSEELHEAQAAVKAAADDASDKQVRTRPD